MKYHSSTVCVAIWIFLVKIKVHGISYKLRRKFLSLRDDIQYVTDRLERTQGSRAKSVRTDIVVAVHSCQSPGNLLIKPKC